MNLTLAKEMLPENSNNADEVIGLAASTSSVLHILNYILPNVNKLLEDNIMLISDSFTNIAETSSLIEKSLDNNNLAEVRGQIKEISKNVSSAIVGLQFQDRVSQNLAICTIISSVINEHISKTILSSENQIIANLDISRQIYDKIFLGEIRNEFVDFLMAKNLINSPDDLGHKTADETQHNEDIELF
jgi:hypothetical protein